MHLIMILKIFITGLIAESEPSVTVGEGYGFLEQLSFDKKNPTKVIYYFLTVPKKDIKVYGAGDFDSSKFLNYDLPYL